MPTTEKSPEFYKHYPALFHTYFPTISAETLHLLCKAGYTYYNLSRWGRYQSIGRDACLARGNN